MSLWMMLTGASTLINQARNSCIIVLVTFPRWDCCLPRWLIAYSSEVLMQAYPSGTEGLQATNEFLRGVAEAEHEKERSVLSTAALFGVVGLAWKLRKFGKRP
jgi:hypothetical protein